MKCDIVDLSRMIRVKTLEMVHRANASHVGSCLSIADIIGVLYGSYLSVRPNQPDWLGRDRFILSKGHSCAAVYAALALRGFIPISQLETFGEDGSQLMAHISHKIPGVEFSTGSLGHGMPFGAGKALAAKRMGEAWRVVVLVSDGEMDEGANWECMIFAAHHCLDNLVVLIDYNKLQSLGTIAQTLKLEPLVDKLRSFGWSAREVSGHDHLQISDALNSAPWEIGKPSIIVAHTIKGKGVSFMENLVEWHYRAPNDVQLAAALAELRGCDA